jgi:hypothetical protein
MGGMPARSTTTASILSMYWFGKVAVKRKKKAAKNGKED